MFPFPSRNFFFLQHKGKTQLAKCDIIKRPIRSISALKLMLFSLPETTNWESVIALQLHLQNFSIEAYVPFSSRSSYDRENVSRKPAHLQGSSIETCGFIFFLKGLADSKLTHLQSFGIRTCVAFSSRNN
jgi:hypothetical protein